MERRKLTIVIPAYNESKFIGRLLEKVLAVELSQFDLDKEVIVIDDRSTDCTADVVRAFENVVLHRHRRNTGKGGAVKTGVKHATGDYLIIQDADLEYDPNDYVQMIRALLTEECGAVYGSRYLKYPGRGKLINLFGGKHRGQSWRAYIGGQTLSFAGVVFTGRYLTDTVTALKLFRREVIEPLELQTNGFELDHEISAKILAQGCSIKEVPISYFPRSKGEGKKIGLRDWFVAIKTFYRYRNG